MKSVCCRLLRLVHDPSAPWLSSWPESGARAAAAGSLCKQLIALGTALKGPSLTTPPP